MSTTTFTRPSRPLTWLITGCSSGFGLTLARIVQTHGHQVIATARHPSRTPDIVAEIERHGGKCLTLDVDDPDSGRVIEGLETAGQEIDVLVNNAGFATYAPVEQLDEEEVRGMMESMYFGPVRLMRATVPYMRKRRFGVVVNMSSGAALEGRESMGAYAGAKAGLDGMAKVLAKEVAPFNIRVLTVVLGTFDTGMLGKIATSKNPMPVDYQGSVADQTIQMLTSGVFKPDGDKDKAMNAVYDVVTGEGVGAGREGERLLPLGRDMTARVKLVQEQLAHSLEVFGEVCNSVYRDA